jgi:hypothetical protein
MNNILIHDFQRCVESQMIEVMNMKMYSIQLRFIANRREREIEPNGSHQGAQRYVRRRNGDDSDYIAKLSSGIHSFSVL